MSSYPSEICHDCGTKHGRMPAGHVATYYPGTCGWCGQDKTVTEPRDYRYPPAPQPQDQDYAE